MAVMKSDIMYPFCLRLSGSQLAREGVPRNSMKWLIGASDLGSTGSNMKVLPASYLIAFAYPTST